jgi:fused signal recognition particle receptor
VARRELDRADKLRAALKDHIRSFLEIPAQAPRVPGPGEPLVIMVIGVNGVGKTTTIGKAAHRYRGQGKKVMLVAADTFRAAAVEQLEIWGERVGADVIKQREGADPSAVAFDALTAALSRRADVVLIDTAGRLHTKSNLMEELKKVRRVIGRKLPGAPHEVWLVLDATTGQNAISQAEMFHEALGITGIVLTKLDGTAKGGIVVGISHQLRLPILFIGIGEGIDDLRPFDASDFVEAIFE